MLTETKAHTQYHLANGTIVPGVTTVLGILEKEGLHYWIADVTRAGDDWIKVRDSAAAIGTLAHLLIRCHLQGDVPDTSEYSPEQVIKAKTCLGKYLRWEKKHTLSPVMMETPLVSEEFRYGGTLDLFAELDGEFALVDFKTGGSGIYPEMFHQLAAYWHLLTEQGWSMANARILRIDAAENGDSEERIKTSLANDWQIFIHCLEIYRLQKSPSEA